MQQEVVRALQLAIQHANMLTNIILEAIAGYFCKNADAKQLQCKCYGSIRANANANASAHANENAMQLQTSLNASAKPNAMQLQL